MRAAPANSATSGRVRDPRSVAGRLRAAVGAAVCACTDTACNIAGLRQLQRLSPRAVQLALVAGPVAIAFASGGFGDSPRSVAAIAAWALVALAALTWSP